MAYALVFLLGIAAGAISILGIFAAHRSTLTAQKRRQDADEARIQVTLKAAAQRKSETERQVVELQQSRAEFESRAISYVKYQNENVILKRDLQNIDVNVRKLELDRRLQREDQEKLDERCRGLGDVYLKENVKWIGSLLTANNYVNSKKRLKKAVERCRGIGLDVSSTEEQDLLTNLETEFKKVVRAAQEREEQSRIKAQIREERARERDIERELKKLDSERAAIKAALDKALAESVDKHSAEIERLEVRLAEAEEKSKRAISQAQMTKSGYVYVISNIGSFGEGIYKIGMSRRLEPMERVKELGSASVPFPFDVHMMVSCDNAPALENALHRTLHKQRMNKIKPRKEFFRTDIETIHAIVQEHHGEVEYVADAEALEYQQSMAITSEDEEFIEHLYSQMDEEREALGNGD